MPKIEDADATTDPAARSWIGVAGDSDFPIQNLPYGIFARADDVATIGVAIGDRILDLCAVAAAGLLDDAVPEARVVFAEPTLNGFIACGRPTWRAARERIFALLGVGNRELHDAEILDYALVAADEIEMRLPVAVGDYVDFYSSLNHATNAGRIFRPNAEPLFPNWRRLPVGYHGRSGSVVVSGTPIVRPSGQKKIDGADEPAFGPTEMLDFELEIGFITGDANGLGATLPVVRARDAIFGVVLLNDWSARDIQAWESQPLGPFLGKSFATSISPWVVTLDALAPFRVAGPPQMPPPSPYLAVAEPRGYSIDLTVELQSKMMRAAGIVAQTLARTNARELYWSIDQQLAHLASNGSTVRAGDLCGSGTISGATPDSFGSLLELTWRGTRPLTLGDSEPRAFLTDGDVVMMRGWCEGPSGDVLRIGFGEVRGTVVRAPEQRSE